MELNKRVFGALALGCLGAAAGGGFLAARRTPTTAAAIVAPAAPAAAVAADTGKAVAESEGIITPEPTPTASREAAAAENAPRREATSEARPAPGRRETVTRPAPAPRQTPREMQSEPGPARQEPATRRAETPPAQNTPAPSGGSAWEVRPSVEPERAAVTTEPDAPAAPAAPELVDLVVPADAVLGLQIERAVSSETARVEDRVEARVTRDVRVGDRVAIPAGSLVQGSVMEVERGGKVKERARLGIRFHTVVLGDGTRLAIRTESVVREGASPANESAAKIGGAAVGGAILGAILGGGKGAVIGGSVGAAGGTAATMAGNRNPAILPAGTTVSVRVQQPVTVTVEK